MEFFKGFGRRRVPEKPLAQPTVPERVPDPALIELRNAIARVDILAPRLASGAEIDRQELTRRFDELPAEPSVNAIHDIEMWALDQLQGDRVATEFIMGAFRNFYSKERV